MTDFAGKTLILDSVGVQSSLDVLGSQAADIWAVMGVETSGCGYLPDRRVKILFERHIFSSLTGGRFDAANPSLSSPTPGGYGAGGAHQYERLESAIELDRQSALSSCSWGLGQVMGSNAKALGFDDVENMVSLMTDSENVQLEAMARFIKNNGLDGALRTHDWARFARGYNGSNYRINNYDSRLAATYQLVSSGGMPDLAVRAAQAYLTFLGFDPNGIDGVMGRLTRSAMNDYQHARKLPLTELVDDGTLTALRTEVSV